MEGTLMSENKTVFEMIIDRDIDANIIYEDDNFIAFLDAFPVVKGHTLVVPKKRIENIFDLDDETANDYMLSLIHISEPTRLSLVSRMPSSA